MSRFRAILTRVFLNPVVLAALVVGLVLAAPHLEAGTVQILTFSLVAVIFAQSINILTGLAGQISLGHAGFFGIGAYGTAILSKTHDVSLLLSIPAGAVMAGAVGYLLSFPAGRVREVYLAMMTVGFSASSSTKIVLGVAGRDRLAPWPFPEVASAALRNSHDPRRFELDGVDYFPRRSLSPRMLVLWLSAQLRPSRRGAVLDGDPPQRDWRREASASRAGEQKRLRHTVVSGLIAASPARFTPTSSAISAPKLRPHALHRGAGG